MTRQWAPGDVAMVAGTWRTGDGVEARKASRDGQGWDSFDGAYIYDADVVGDPRPLVVLDLDFPRTVVKHLRMASENDSALTTLGRLADQIEPQVTPKPVEPLGLGAVVIDRDGSTLVRVDNSSHPWRASGGHRFAWEDVDHLTTLADGVEPMADWEIDLLRGAR